MTTEDLAYILPLRLLTEGLIAKIVVIKKQIFDFHTSLKNLRKIFALKDLFCFKTSIISFVVFMGTV